MNQLTNLNQEILSLTLLIISRMTSSHPVAALCQLTSTPDKEANFTTCERLIKQAKEGGANMIFLPEGFDYLGSSREETLQLSESLQGDIITRYSQLARCLGHDKHFFLLLKHVLKAAVKDYRYRS